MLRGADDTHIHAHHLVAAERHHLAILDHVQQPRLQCERHVADLVQEQRAAVRLQNAAHAALAGGAGEGAPLVTEQLALDQGLGNGGAVDRHEGLVGAATGVMDGARAIALAGTGFAEQQHRDVAIDDPPQDLHAGVHGRIRGLQAIEGAARLGSARLALRAHTGADTGLRGSRRPCRRMHARKPAPLGQPRAERLGRIAAVSRQAHQRREARIEDALHRLPAHRLVVSIPEQFERGAVGALDEALIVERQHAFARRADEFRTAVKAHHVEFLAGAQQGAVFDVLRRHVDQRQGVGLRTGRGTGDVERCQQFPAHVEDRRCRAGQLRVLRQEVVGAMDHDGPLGDQAGPHAVGTHLALAPHHSFAETAAPGRSRKARVTEVAHDHPVAIGQHDAVLGVLHELPQGLHLDTRDG